MIFYAARMEKEFSRYTERGSSRTPIHVSRILLEGDWLFQKSGPSWLGGSYCRVVDPFGLF